MEQAEGQGCRIFPLPQQVNRERTDRVRSHHGGQLHVHFREMKLEDIPGVLEIEHASFTLPWTEEAFRNEITNNLFAKYLVMMRGERIIGYAGMWTILDEAHMTNIAVHPDFRGQQLGERLFSKLVQYARDLHMQRITLEVRVTNDVARCLYAKFGFTPQGVRKNYYSDNEEDALIMWSDLELTVPYMDQEA